MFFQLPRPISRQTLETLISPPLYAFMPADGADA